MNKKIFLIRLDKMGDLIATLPVDQAPWLKGYEVHWVVEENVAFLAKFAEPERNCFPLSLKSPWQSFKKLYALLQQEKPTYTLIFYGPWWLGLACWLAKVPQRSGRLSQWHSYLFLNRGLRQSRSQSEHHEILYNWRLLQFLFQIKIPLTEDTEALPTLKIKAPLQRQLLEKWQVSPKNYTVVHPGMAGSALNWPQSKYNELIENLVEFTTVVITGTASDSRWLSEIAPRWQKDDRIRWTQGKLNSSELIYLLQNASRVIGPSTGILHLAAATGTPTVGIYSPILAHHPRRWGLRGYGSRVLLPPVNCAAQGQCLKEKCPHYSEKATCMDQITVDQVLKDSL